ncbi:MAG: acyl-CoA dehydrogenase [Betaproteobacteria bacterium]|nr:acyl-CoA dehydrogenase [Betaproteobacteria bacterium]
MNLRESEALRAFRSRVRDWMSEHFRGEFRRLTGVIGPGSESFDCTLAKAWERTIASGGWVGLSWPVSEGGQALSIAHEMVFQEEYVKAGGPGRLGHIGEHLLAPTLIAEGTQAQKARFLPPILKGEEFWAQGYSEPGAGSDLASLRTQAVWSSADQRWRVTGQKVWTSWARESDWAFVLARCEPGTQRHRGLVLLMVRLDQPGVTIRPIQQISGASEFNELFLDEAEAGADAAIGAPGDGWRVAMDLLAHERGASTLGQQAQFVTEFDRLTGFLTRQGLLQEGAISEEWARHQARLRTLRHHALRVTSANALPNAHRAASVSKYLWSNWRRDAGHFAARCLARVPAADRSEAEVVRHLRAFWLTSKADTIYAGTNEIQLNLIAQRSLGLPRASS